MFIHYCLHIFETKICDVYTPLFAFFWDQNLWSLYPIVCTLLRSKFVIFMPHCLHTFEMYYSLICFRLSMEWTKKCWRQPKICIMDGSLLFSKMALYNTFSTKVQPTLYNKGFRNCRIFSFVGFLMTSSIKCWRQQKLVTSWV